MTLDLDTQQHRDLKRFALVDADNSSLADVLRAAVTLLLTDDAVATKVKLEVYRTRERRR